MNRNKENYDEMLSHPIGWWFVFTDRNVHHPVAKLCKKGFQHVNVLTEWAGITFMVEPLGTCVEHTFTAEHKLPVVIRKFRDLGYTVVFIRWAATKVRLNPFMTCATYCAYTAGIPFYGVTPYQLYRKLLKLGGEDLTSCVCQGKDLPLSR